MPAVLLVYNFELFSLDDDDYQARYDEDEDDDERTIEEEEEQLNSDEEENELDDLQAVQIFYSKEKDRCVLIFLVLGRGYASG